MITRSLLFKNASDTLNVTGVFYFMKEDWVQILLFLGHSSLIKNKTQTAVINILNLLILIMT